MHSGGEFEGYVAKNIIAAVVQNLLYKLSLSGKDFSQSPTAQKTNLPAGFAQHLDMYVTYVIYM